MNSSQLVILVWVLSAALVGAAAYFLIGTGKKHEECRRGLEQRERDIHWPIGHSGS